ncbi:MAG: endonuclease domain-containing protein [Ignavibacteriaceae bacterium]|nr:endonuclease domain-containing protein [Ignavibacteriaceae bacterium]
MRIFPRSRNTKGQKFRRQYSVDSYVIDFYCPSLKLAIEIDGEIHEQEDQKKYDAERQKHIEAYGIRFMRIKNEEIMNDMDKVMKAVEDKINLLLTEQETSP